MSVAIVTGSSGLIGSETVRFLHEKGMHIIGLDNDMRSYYFGEAASTDWNTTLLSQTLNRFEHRDVDIRDERAVNKIFAHYAKDITMVVHTAAQPSHDWAAKEPFTDFTVNANGTLVLLEATRQHCPSASFIFTSTNKVYGDTPNFLPLVERETRWELDTNNQYAEFGIDETMTIDSSKHSLFGASKVAADILVQEYGRYFDMNTVCFRGGCLTGPAHSGAELHGFLAYLVKCVVEGLPYTVFGYKGKQVRDNIHSFDLVNAFWHYSQAPKSAVVYNIGGSRFSNCSMLEAIQLAEELSGRELDYSISHDNRSGDHIWWISDVRTYERDYPDWSYQYDHKDIMKQIVDAAQDQSKSA